MIVKLGKLGALRTNEGNCDMPPRGQGRVRDTQDDARPDSANTQAGDNLRQDAYPGRQPVERVERQAINSIRSQNFDNPFDRLDQARAAWHQGGFEAAVPHYFAAIDAADRIDQTEVAAERKRLKTQLNSERDPAKRRELVQYDMTLHDMQRAPGVVRANLGLAYLRNGRQAEGVRMLLEAQRLDPEMAADPNFQRHLEMLDQAGVPDGRRQYEQPIDRGGTQPRDQRGGQPADRRTQSAGERTQPTDQGSGNPTGERGQQPGDQRGGLPTDQGTQQPTDRKTQSTDGTGTQPTDQVTLPSGNNRPDAQTFDNPFVHIQKANEALVKAGTLSPEIKAEYEAAIKAADSIDRKYLLEQAKPLQEALVKAYPQETQQKVATLEQERNAMFQKLPQETQTKLKELDAKFAAATTDAEREAIKKQIKELAPDLAKKQEEIDALTAQPRAILEQLKLIESMMNASALARFAYAEALRKTGDKENAKKLLEEVAKLDPSAAKDEKFQAAAKDVGLAVPSEGQVATKPEGQVATQPEAQTRDKPEGQVEQPTAGAPQIDNGTFDLLQKAHETNEKQGFAAAKPLYEQAIAAAGGIDQAKIDQQLKEAEAKLKTTDEQAKTLRAQLPADKQQKFAELETQLSKATTQEAVQPILGQMLEVAPDLTRKMAEQADQQQSVFALTQIKHAPFTATFQFGLAQHNAGDVAGGKATLQKAAAMDPEAAQEPVFKAAMSLIDKPDKITDEALKQAAASQGGGSSGGVRGDSSGSPAIDDPTDHIRAAMAHQEKGNAKSAEEEWKKAIAAADTLLATPGASERLKAALQQAEQELAQAKAKQDPTKPDTLLAASEAQKMVDGLKEFMSLPALARQQAAIFYLENGKADEAKALLEQALQKDPSLATQERFKKLAEVARDNSRGTLEKSLAFLKKAKDEIISDGGAGMVGLAVSAVTPGKYLKVAAGIAAGGLTKHGLN
ncbi:MAG: hypothetical protein HY711_02750, partial [Candidatus Melainabacteria bacterium]|nr:hypothetical protein [Candidatus Melainabacteria bacterium]